MTSLAQQQQQQSPRDYDDDGATLKLRLRKHVVCNAIDSERRRWWSMSVADFSSAHPHVLPPLVFSPWRITILRRRTNPFPGFAALRPVN